MSLVLIIWTAAASASLTLAGVHLIIWLKMREAHTHLLFFLAALAGAGMAFFELKMMTARTPEEFSSAVRWFHVPAWLFVSAMTVFVLLRLNAGRRWLAWTVIAVRTSSLAINFLVGQNLNFVEISSLRSSPFLGESVSLPEGVTNLWTLLGSFSVILFVVFVLDASVSAWRRGARRLALTTGGSVTLFGLASMALAGAFVFQLTDWPYSGSLFFMAIVAAMSFELGGAVVDSAHAANRLKESEASLRETERRLDDAAGAGDLGSWEWNILRDEVWATRRCRNLFGLDPTQRLDSEAFFAAIHPDDRQAVTDAVKHALAQRTSLELEYRTTLPAGGWRWIVTRARIGAASGGSVELMHGVSINITRHKQLEERFRRVVRAAPVGMMTLKRDGTIDLINAWVESTFGYSAQELAGKPVHTLIPELADVSDGSGCWRVADLTANVDVEGHQASAVRKDGSEVPLELGIEVIEGMDGSDEEVLVTMTDISDRMRSERVLKTERAFLRQLIDRDPNLIFVKDREGRFILANQALADIYGTTVQDLVGKTDADFNDNAREVEHFRRIDREVIESGLELVVPEETITDAAGRVHYLQAVKRRITGPDDTNPQLLGTATDITARKLSEESIRRSEEFSRSVLASLQDHVVILDREGVVIAVNEVWRDFDVTDGRPTSMSRDAIGRDYLEICTYSTPLEDATGSRARAGIRAVLRRERSSFTMEYNPTGPKHSKWILMRVLPLEREEGGVIILHHDITDRKKAELELAQQRSELAHFSRVTMLGHLSGSLAHELNQPLAAILSNAQAAIRFLDNDNYDRNEVREILRDIASDDKRAGDVIQGLRLLLKKGETRYEPVHPNDLVRDVSRMIRSEILNARVALTIDLEPNLPSVTGDRVQLEQVLLNLVMNACDAMVNTPAAKRHLVIRTTDRKDGYLQVCVLDRGPGIRPEELEQVFEPFYTTKVGGLGLGLAVSRRIVVAHGGSLRAESNGDGGAQFCFTLPISKDDQ